MAATIGLMVGWAIVNALAFSGNNFLFSSLKSSGVDEEGKRHNKAIKQLQAAHEAWTKKRTERLEELRRQANAVKAYRDVDEAMWLYSEVTRKKGHLWWPWTRAPALWLLHLERQPKRQRDCFHPYRNGRDRPGSI